MSFEFSHPIYLTAIIPAAMLLWIWHRHSLADLPDRQRLFSLLLRSLIMLLLAAAAAGMTLLQRSSVPWTVFLQDVSRSTGQTGLEQADDFLRRAVSVTGNARTTWIPFAASPGIPRLTIHRETNGIAPSVGSDNTSAPGADKAPVDPNGTNIELALNLAQSSVPSGFVPRIVLLTDGNQTSGSALQTTLKAGAEVWTVPLNRGEDPEVQIDQLVLPPEVRQGEPFPVEVVVSASHADSGRLELFQGEFRVRSTTVQIQPGQNTFRFEQSVDRDRMAAFRVRISGLQKDTLLDNNTDIGLVSASGQPRILLADSDPDLIQELAFALEGEGVLADVRPPEGIPTTIEGLQNYELLISSNIPATALSRDQLQAIRSWVEDFGGGFLMLGGEQSFGPGGWYQTPLDDILPLQSDFRKEQEKPSLGMVLVIDRSGSMEGEKLEMARAAARAAVRLLSPRDQVAVIAFDDKTWVISEFQAAANQGRLVDQIGSLKPGGGTSMYPAMEMASEILENAAVRLKHVIVLTDGISNTGDFEGLAGQMSAAGTTVSVVAVGDEDATDIPLLTSISRIGRGRFYHAEDPALVPRIFARETMTASKSAIDEDPFAPQVMRATRALAGIDFELSPFLLGYVRTRPQPGSEVILATEKGDPLLAWWRVGLGMTGGFTSDASSRWAAEWLTWPGYGRFWTQVVRQLMRRESSSGMNIKLTRSGKNGRIQVQLTDGNGAFVSDAKGDVLLSGPDQQQTRLDLTRTAAGVYTADLTVDQPGVWNLDVSLTPAGGEMVRKSRSIYTGFPEELRLQPVNRPLLEQLAERTGGIYGPDPQQLTKPAAASVTRPRPLRTLLLALAALLLIPDVLFRRLELGSFFGGSNGVAQ